MVKLFKRKKGKETATFKFDGSIKLKDLPIEEYAHVAYAFHVSVLRFERMLKESLLEGYITSTTLERISQEFKIASIKELAIPETESVTSLFGDESLNTVISQRSSSLEEKKTLSTEPTSPETVTPTAIPIEETVLPDTVVPEPVVPEITAETPEIIAPIPKISFSFPSPTSQPETSPETPTDSVPIVPEKPLTPPTIPKISFPASSSSSTSPPSNPLANIRGRKEEDRATGIAILRKQMLTELKKIRSVVAEQDQ